jgi:hypothetical protein
VTGTNRATTDELAPESLGQASGATRHRPQGAQAVRTAIAPPDVQSLQPEICAAVIAPYCASRGAQVAMT